MWTLNHHWCLSSTVTDLSLEVLLTCICVPDSDIISFTTQPDLPSIAPTWMEKGVSRQFQRTSRYACQQYPPYQIVWYADRHCNGGAIGREHRGAYVWWQVGRDNQDNQYQYKLYPHLKVTARIWLLLTTKGRLIAAEIWREVRLLVTLTLTLVGVLLPARKGSWTLHSVSQHVTGIRTGPHLVLGLVLVSHGVTTYCAVIWSRDSQRQCSKWCNCFINAWTNNQHKQWWLRVLRR